jgi:outer membrane protein OmpU
MRKLLLGCAATLTGMIGYAGINAAMAQTATTSPTISTSPTGATSTNLSPGSISVRLNGRINWYAGIEASSVDSNNPSAGGDKTSTTNFLGYMRLYPGFDGVAANGLHYGAAAEIRMNGESSATAGANSETLYVFQAYGYFGLPQFGQISFGQENGPSVIFETGTFEGFNDGGWNGDIEGMIPTVANPVYPFPDSGSQYDQASSKIVYLSPTLAGFQFAFGFTPNQTAENFTDAPTSVTSAIIGGLPRNMIDIGGQYTQTFGPVGLQAGLDYTNAGQVNGTASGDHGPTGYKDMSIVSGGITATIAGFTFGGNSSYGAFNLGDGDDFQLEPDGGTAAVGWLVGGQYTAGPWIVGASFFRFNQTGDIPGGVDEGSGATITPAGLSTGQQQNDGVAAGATYTLVPGVSLFADYLYGFRQQGGYNFATGNAGTANNYVQSQLFGVGTQIQW